MIQEVLLYLLFLKKIFFVNINFSFHYKFYDLLTVFM